MANFQRDMGIGVLGRPDLSFKRQNRFTFEIVGFCGDQKNRVPDYFVQVASRPKLSMDETEVNFLNAKMFIPGKGTWETMTVSYLDISHHEMRPLYNWLATVYNFTDPIRLNQGNKRDWDATGILNMYDGCGSLLEQWQLQHMWPQAIDFGEVDMSSSEIAKIDLTIRFSDVVYRSYCPDWTPESCCTPCSTTSQVGVGAI